MHLLKMELNVETEVELEIEEENAQVWIMDIPLLQLRNF